MAIEREAVRGVGQAPATVKRGFRRLAPKTPQMLPDVGMPQGAQVMNALVRASGILATEAGKHFQRKIAEDTVQQQSRAMRNLEPSDDATVAGYRAHSIIGLQNNVLSLSKEVEAEAATFTGTDDEWDEYLGSSFGAMHDNFLLEHPHLEGDVNALSAMNALFGEQLPKLGVARISGKLEQEHLKRQKAFQDNILLRLEGLDGANLTTAANAIMDDGAATLKLTMQEREAMLGQAAINAAKDGDLRLINYTKVFTGNQEASMFERVAGLQDAERAALKLNETRGIAEIAEMKDVNSADLRSGVINAEAFYQNAETIGGYTLAGARSEVARINQIRAEQQRLQLAKEFAGPVTPLDSKTSEGVIQLMQQDMFQAIEDRTKDVTPEQHAAIVQEEKRKMYKQISDKHIHNKQWQDMFDMLPNINPDQLRDAEKLPDNIREAIDLYRALPVGSQRDHDTEKTATLFANYEAFRQQGEGETQAFLAAQRSANNPIPIDAPMRKKAIEAAIEAAEDFSTSAWWSKLLGAPKDLPDWNKARIARQFQVATLANIGAGYVDPRGAAEAVTTGYGRYFTRTESGQVLFGNRQAIATEMGVQHISGDDIDITLETYKRMNQVELEDLMHGGDIDDIQFEIVPNRGTVILKEGPTGRFLKGPIPLSSLKHGRSAYLDEQRVLEREEGTLYAPGAAGKREATPFTTPIGGSLTTTGAAGKVPSAVDHVSEIPRAPTDETVPDDRQEQAVEFASAIMDAENDRRVGFDKFAQVWNPHSDPAGNATIAYGHLLTEQELAQGLVYINGKGYPYKEGDSLITEELGSQLFEQDLSSAEEAVSNLWAGYNELPWKYQKVLTNLQYNTGATFPRSWPKLKKAMKEGDDAKVRAEMITYFELKGKKVYLANRAEAVANAVGLAVPEEDNIARDAT